MIKIENLHFNYGKASILKDININFQKGLFYSIVGPNGSGKSTFLKCILKINQYKKGSIHLKNKNITRLSYREIAKVASFVPQVIETPFNITVFDVILLGRKPYLNWKMGKKDKDIVFDVLKDLNITHLAFKNFSEISGGERQKVLIARALAANPEILLLDEPLNNLDLKHQLEILEIIKNLVEKKNILVIMVIHDLNLALNFSDKTVAFKNGKIIFAGDVTNILNPENIKKIFEIDTKIGNINEQQFIIPFLNNRM